MAERYDVVLFGATGYTGKNTIKYINQLTKENGRNYTWAIAGRSEAKLKAVLKEMGSKVGKDFTNTPLIIADVSDVSSLEEMTKKARVIINTCGPYHHFGEPVIKACVENGCHHVDVSGEPYFIEEMQYKYHKQAQEKGVYIVSACGLDSIPCDLGVLFLQSKFEGTLNSVETYLSGGDITGKSEGPSANTGTWNSGVYAINTLSKLKALRVKLYPNKLPRFTPKLKRRLPIHIDPLSKDYALPFLGADRSVAARTQRYLYEEEKKRPVQIGTYFNAESFVLLLMYALMGFALLVLGTFKFGRYLLLKYPRFFSFGIFTPEGPAQEVIENKKFTLTLIGEGWSEKKDDPNEEFITKPDKKLIAQVNGWNPVYGATCLSLTLCGLMILDNPDKLPKKGGVYSPGATFYNTSIINELHRNGFTFDIIKK